MADRSIPACSVPDCTKPARSYSADLCKMHYHRLYRHGSVDRVARGSGTPTASAGRRYRQKLLPAHPLAHKDGRVYIHRLVLFDAIGIGPHLCHWCDCEVFWGRGDDGNLVPDHLNGIGDDNRIENLVPSCQPCNSARGSRLKHEALVAAGWWSSHDTIAVLGSRSVREW